MLWEPQRKKLIVFNSLNAFLSRSFVFIHIPIASERKAELMVMAYNRWSYFASVSSTLKFFSDIIRGIQCELFISIESEHVKKSTSLSMTLR